MPYPLFAAAMEPLLGNKAARFDATKFSWLGSMSQDISYCGVWQSPDAAKSFDEMLTRRSASNPTGRVGDPEEFGAACAFLCAASSGFIVGQNLLLDGGAFNSTMG